MQRGQWEPTEEYLIVSWVGDEVTAVSGPVQVGNKAGVALEKRMWPHNAWGFCP